ncbi:MAG TPA: pyridoxamine 5'-phosphate oxidase [Gemmatimonadaceae bacterium]|nr:pyridoxamine 5'-phosphate oxidase [Gemmatimonadaceae bacterium]
MIAADPIARFREVYAMAEKIDRALVPDVSAMSLATSEAGGPPSVRIVLLKGFDDQGFVFYTNLESRKGKHLLAQPKAALCFYWPPIDIQVRIEGNATRVMDAEADVYFASRPRPSQIGAWASRQSEPLDTPASLEERVARHEKEFEGRDVPRPDFWSGFRVWPERIEFWKNRPNRLHERHLYTRAGDRWKIETLYP